METGYLTQETPGAKLYSEVWPDALLNFENIYSRISVAMVISVAARHPEIEDNESINVV